METRHANDFRPLLDRTPRFLDRVNTPWDDVPDLQEYNHHGEHEEVRTTLLNQRLVEYQERKTGGTPQRLYRLA
jgi:hypothetical protein